MVAVIHSSAHLTCALYYNENKVKQKMADCLTAVNYPKDAHELSVTQKLKRLTNLSSLNSRTKINAVHVSLNFDPSEKLSAEKLVDIASTYMEKIGFGQQPYLVYQHHDSGHPHLHIVTTNIKADGKRIALHNLGRNESENARKQIEQEYQLVRASSAELKNKNGSPLLPVNPTKVTYGKSPTKRAIANVVTYIVSTYFFTSLPELSAVLGLYNVTADRGEQNSRIFQRGGLVYRVLDAKGKKIGVPMKASSLPNKPTLANLEKKFAANKISRDRFTALVKTKINWVVNARPTSLEQFIQSLQQQHISVVLRKSTQGQIFGITYIDHQHKCVFNGSDLGKSFAAKAILEKCTHPTMDTIPEQSSTLNKSPNPSTFQLSLPFSSSPDPAPPLDLRNNKKRKRKKRLT